MFSNALLAEIANIVPAMPGDLSATGGMTTPPVRLRHYDRATLVLIKAAGTAGDDPTITITQGDGISGGNLTNAKAVSFTRISHKRHASALPKVYTYAEAAAGNTYTSDTLAEERAVICIDITPDMLDADNRFDCVRAAIADVGANAQLACMFWILWAPQHAVVLNAED